MRTVQEFFPLRISDIFGGRCFAVLDWGDATFGTISGTWRANRFPKLRLTIGADEWWHCFYGVWTDYQAFGWSRRVDRSNKFHSLERDSRRCTNQCDYHASYLLATFLFFQRQWHCRHQLHGLVCSSKYNFYLARSSLHTLFPILCSCTRNHLHTLTCNSMNGESQYWRMPPPY